MDAMQRRTVSLAAYAVSLVLSSRTPQCTCGAHSLSSEVTSSEV